MDCQHEYVSAGDSDHHGLLFDDPGECIDQVAEKRMIETAWGKAHRALR
jgi:hypothetical protein